MSGDILIVDDNSANRKLIGFLLSKRGHVVREAADGRAALLAIEAAPVKLILMDLQLPGVDGLQLTRKLKGDPKTNHIIIIVVTASAMKGDEERARAAGCDGYVTKPIDTRTLPEVIARFLG
jgi:CheY-like chemotaxis protein